MIRLVTNIECTAIGCSKGNVNYEPGVALQRSKLPAVLADHDSIKRKLRNMLGCSSYDEQHSCWISGDAAIT